MYKRQPYIYEGGVYAVPETQNFDMLFYRTDVFAELGLTPPETWEAVSYTHLRETLRVSPSSTAPVRPSSS